MTRGAVPEGVQQFAMAHETRPLPADCLAPARELDALRSQLRGRGWLGQDPRRYEGYGYGNLSARLDERSFLISASQTGHLDSLGPEGYTVIATCDFAANRVESIGPGLPSSEALTHAAVYGLDPTWRFVLHVHDAELYAAAQRRGLPATPDEATNGTIALVRAIERLGRTGAFDEARAFWMRGHRDGLVSFGGSGEEALRALVALATVPQRAARRTAPPPR
jgi:ribulose-5-phosphate 4-epimerase/fuculose-1-phosphate aldolase